MIPLSNSTANGSSTTPASAAIAQPTVGQYIKIIVAWVGTATVTTPPAGFSLEGQKLDGGVSGNNIAVYTKFAVGADALTYSLTLSASQPWAVIAELWPVGISTTIPITSFQSAGASFAATQAQPTASVTPTTVGTIPVAYFTTANSAAIPTGLTAGWTIDTTNTGTTDLNAQYHATATVDTTTAQQANATWDAAVNGCNLIVLMPLAPAIAGGGLPHKFWRRATNFHFGMAAR